MRSAPQPYDSEIRAEALDRIEKGDSCRTLSRELGISLGTLTRWARKAGLPLRPGRPRKRSS
jgi:transposase